MTKDHEKEMMAERSKMVAPAGCKKYNHDYGMDVLGTVHPEIEEEMPKKMKYA